jgi:hypothetical protein
LIPSKTAGGLISDNKVFLIWLTPTGDTIETKFFQVDSTGLYFAKGDLHICPDESFVFGGTFSNEYLNIADFFLTKFNAWGDTLWFRQYKAPLNDICRGVKPTADGGFALAGKSRSFGDPDFGQFHLMKTDSLGNMEWRQSYGQNGVSEDASSLTLTPEGDYMLAGLKGPNGSTEVRVMRVDSDGNLQWQKTFGGAANAEAYPAITALADGNFLLIGALGIGLGQEAWLAKIDGNGNLLWEKSFPGDNDTFFQHAVEMDNGDLAVVGQDYFYNPDVPIYYLKSTVTRLTPEGGLIWKRYHYTREDRDNYLFDIVRTSDGGFLAGGFALSDTSDRQDAWVVKMDSLGCAVPGCELVNSTEDKEETLAGVTLKMTVSPNPYREVTEVGFYLEHPVGGLVLETFGPTGKLMNKMPLPGNPGWNAVRFDGAGLPSGAYFFVLKADSTVISTCHAVRID